MTPLLQINGLCKQYKDFVLEDVSFELQPGYIMGLIGPNGAGKSTTIRMIMGLVKPDGGSIKVFGLNALTQGKLIRERIGYVCDESPFYEMLNPRELERIIAPFYRSWDQKTYRTTLKEFELPLTKPIKQFSKGMKMKLSLAVALSYNAELILMDEPTSGLDPVFRRELLDILMKVIQDENKGILLSTHITNDLERIADYITFLNDGKVVFTMEKELVDQQYMLVKGPLAELNFELRSSLIGLQESSLGFEGLLMNSAKGRKAMPRLAMEKASLDDIMLYTMKGGN